MPPLTCMYLKIPKVVTGKYAGRYTCIYYYLIYDIQYSKVHRLIYNGNGLSQGKNIKPSKRNCPTNITEP